MLSEEEKREMLQDAHSLERRRGFRTASMRRPKSSRSLNDYIAFLMDVQAVKPFDHKPRVTLAEKNIF
jgi:hypothetical protein